MVRTKLPDFRLIPGDEVADDPASVPDEAGIYLFFLNGGAHLLEATGYFTTESRAPLRADDRLHLYTGAANSLRKRLKQHFHRDMRSSSLRKTLLSIEHANRAISRSRTPKCAITGEDTLSAWLFRNALVAIASTPTPFELERLVLAEHASPFNINWRRANVYSRSLMAYRKVAFPPWRPAHRNGTRAR